MSEYVSPEKQRLIIEKLYYSTDSITSTEKFNKKYQGQLGRVGEKTLTMFEFARKLKKTEFKQYDIQRFIKDITGKDVHLSSL